VEKYGTDRQITSDNKTQSRKMRFACRIQTRSLNN